jgi:DnaJ-class molecular chaperone
LDYYEILGVRPDASETEIKGAYRRLARQYHPDSGDPGDVERFRLVQEAYETLSDSSRRHSYDSRRQAPVSWTGGFEEPIPPFREEIRRPRRRASIHLDLVLTDEEARRGGEAILEVPGDVDCERCAGHGFDFFGWCSACRGDGFTRVYERIRFHIPGGVEGGEVVTARRIDGSTVRALLRVSRS